MTYRAYIQRSFNRPQLAKIDLINSIVDEYQKQGLDMTLRQVYYQLVARGKIPNEDREYNKLGHILKEGRLAGLISWTAIVDRGRSLKGIRTFEHPKQAIAEAAKNYRMDLWATQPWRPEVWVEKQALEGVIAGICNELRVDFFACKGYNSSSEQWAAGQRFADYVQRGQRPIVFHLGDHDPSGLDMTRDNADRLEMFAGVRVPVVRLALNMNQIEELRPPENPTKLNDSRAAEYVEQYGYSSWELDALEPSFIRVLIETNVAQIRDEAAWSQALLQETEDRRWMEEV
jgi:hypothetical protein